MNKKSMVTMMIAIFIMSIMSGLVTAADKPYVTATLINYEPLPAEPGKYVKVYIKMENTGSKTAENVLFEVIPEYPFSLDPGKSAEKSIGLLGAQSFQVIEYNLKVDKQATEGTNKLKVRYNIDSEQKIWVEKELDISVQTHDSVLSINSIKTSPEQIVPGATALINVDIENLADSFISDLTLKLDFSDDDLPFAPYNSASEKSVYQLNSKESKEFQFQIITYPDATAGIYKIPLDITFSDNVGTEYTREEIVGVIVNSEPDIKVVVDSTNIVTGTKNGEVVLKIINKGLTDVKFMNLKIQKTDEFELLSASNEEYIGNLDSDDFETVEYNLYLKGGAIIDIPLELEYRDNNNKLYTEQLSLKLQIHDADKLNQKKGGFSWIAIVIIAAAIVGVVIYRRRKKRKDKKN